MRSAAWPAAGGAITLMQPCHGPGHTAVCGQVQQTLQAASSSVAACLTLNQALALPSHAAHGQGPMAALPLDAENQVGAAAGCMPEVLPAVLGVSQLCLLA